MSGNGGASDLRGIAPFGLILPARVRFGRGEAVAAAGEILGFGRRLVVVHGRTPDRAAPVLAALADGGAAIHAEPCPGEPTLDDLTAALDRGRAFGAEAVVAVGGGAALDLGKALAALLPAPDADPLDHLEVVGKGLPLTAVPLPFVAVPTTAGTGSEATRNAVIGVTEHRRKVSLRDARMMARLAVVDPALTDGTPRGVTMACGLDAVTQVIEPYLSARATPFTDALCRDAIPRGLAALAVLGGGAEDPAARDAMAYVGHVSGIALANAGLGAVHGLAGVLGGETDAPHGAICGQLLPHALLANRAAVAPGSETAERIDRVEGWCRAALGYGLEGLADWTRERGLAAPERPLSREGAVSVATRAAASSSMKANPVVLSPEALVGVLEGAGWVAPD